MHELGFGEAILDAVERRAAGRRVTRVRVRVGALHRVVEPALDQAFSLVSSGTVADGAAVDLVVVPVRVRCLGCGHRAEAGDALAVCAECGGTDLELEGGDDLVLESIELDSGKG
ncbi:MAG TPA: hydrogenase maturation nickel metallochaperone HypA [Actinomycetes bacterium]|nr:hydrogenase maturation nickel metallochaperone HypA [Actinomycetes bacterium]